MGQTGSKTTRGLKNIKPKREKATEFIREQPYSMPAIERLSSTSLGLALCEGLAP